MNDVDVLCILQVYVRIGIWWFDLDSGYMFCFVEVCCIFGLLDMDGFIDFFFVVRVIYLEDEFMVFELIEMMVCEKGLYQFVMCVVECGSGDYWYVCVVG